MPGHVVQSPQHLTEEPEVLGLRSSLASYFWPHTYVEIVRNCVYNHLPLPLIQKGQLSVIGQSMGT